MNPVTLLIILLSITSPSFATVLNINWEDKGGMDRFSRQAIVFAPIHVDGFLGFESSGNFFNSISTENSAQSMQIYLKLGDDWFLFADDESVRGPYHSQFTLENFTFLDVDFSVGALGGINIVERWCCSSYFSEMNAGRGTNFKFEIIPAPATIYLTTTAFILLLLLAKGKHTKNAKILHRRTKIPFGIS